MRALLQRVSRGSVSVDGGPPRNIGQGLVVLLGVAPTDTEKDAEWLANKILSLRLFPANWNSSNTFNSTAPGSPSQGSGDGELAKRPLPSPPSEGGIQKADCLTSGETSPESPPSEGGERGVVQAKASSFDLTLHEVGGEILVVSQFTLYADTRKGRRPDFTKAAPPALARQLYERFVAILKGLHPAVITGEFGARMKVEIVNEGPVTILVDSVNG